MIAKLEPGIDDSVILGWQQMVKQDLSLGTDDKIVSLFHKHVVYLSFVFEKEEEESCKGIVTFFVLSVAGNWFLITAGHCIRNLEKLISAGYQITQSYLIESLGLEARHREAIPFHYEGVQPIYLNIDDGLELDYGFIHLSTYYKELLQKNNIQPFDETTWRLQPRILDFYFLVGLPEDLGVVNNDTIELAPILLVVNKIHEVPDNYPKSELPLFYGHIQLHEDITTIKGMSGGPILGFYENEIGELKYWLIAVQSHWFPSTQVIVAYPTLPLGEFLDSVLSEGSPKIPQRTGEPEAIQQ